MIDVESNSAYDMEEVDNNIAFVHDDNPPGDSQTDKPT